MKTLRILFLAVFFLGIPTAAAYAQPVLGAGLHLGPSGRPTMDIGLFYDDLAPYGYWVDRPAYGWAWVPRNVAPAWRPYTDGYWALTDMGWTWISDEPFGWATYHYGNWYLDPAYGWSWIPGDEWAPARVSWRESNDYIGWAPLPPPRVDLLPASYIFVPARSFLAPDLVTYAVPVVESVRFFPRSRTVTTYRLVNRRLVNFGVPVERVQRFVGRPVPRYQVVDLSPDLRHRGARIAGNRVALFRPQVEKVRVAPPPGRPVARGALMTPRAAATLKAAHASHEVRTERRQEVARTMASDRSRRDLRPGSGHRLEVRHPAPLKEHRIAGGRSAKGPERHRVVSGSRSRQEVRHRSSMAPRREPARMIQRSQHSQTRREVTRHHQSRSPQRMRPPRMERHRMAGPVRGPARGGGHGRRGKPPGS
jgi:hypothetical protein